MRLFRRITGLAAAGMACLLAPLVAAPPAWAKTSIIVTATQIFGTIDPA